MNSVEFSLTQMVLTSSSSPNDQWAAEHVLAPGDVRCCIILGTNCIYDICQHADTNVTRKGSVAGARRLSTLYIV